MLFDSTVRRELARSFGGTLFVMLSIVVTDTEGPYVQKSIAIYESEIKSYNAQLASLQNLIQTYNQALSTHNLDFLTKLTLVTQVDAAIAQTTAATLGNATPENGYGTPSSTTASASPPARWRLPPSRSPSRKSTGVSPPASPRA